VHVFDKNPSIGMDSGSFTVEIPSNGLPFVSSGAPNSSKNIRIDVPLRSFSLEYYPCLAELYRHAGIEFAPTPHNITFSVHTPGLTNVQPVISYSTISLFGYEIMIPDKHLGLVLQARLLADFTRFMYIALYNYDNHSLLQFSNVTIHEYLRSNAYCTEFEDYLLIPFLVTVATCSTKSAQDYPACVVLDFMARHHDVHRGLPAN
jgi:predicted NAD/FAD-binding protein